MSDAPDISAQLGTAAPPDCLSHEDRAYLEENAHRLNSVADIWAAMDAEWHRLGANFDPGGEDAIAAFYRSPVWLLNGLFVETDPESRGHRDAIAAHVSRLAPRSAVDFGGGFGSLARRMAGALPAARVALIEPFPHPLARHLATAHPNLTIEANLNGLADVIVAEDVLEHATDPVGLTATLVAHLPPGGRLIAANCFQPVIACHYPGAFHLHLTYRHVVAPLGLRFIGSVPGAPHAQLFQRLESASDMAKARRLEGWSRWAWPMLSRLRRVKRAMLGRKP
ncbi:MAG: class I SAM-dependent methyltransferase [Rhodobacteraceae bacterium]|jgi:hypothetical protein|nr:class I SAM-dependent methyltransferase [Paracoccaceae bacterium]